MTHKKRTLSVLISLCMVFTMMSVPISADGLDTELLSAEDTVLEEQADTSQATQSDAIENPLVDISLGSVTLKDGTISYTSSNGAVTDKGYTGNVIITGNTSSNTVTVISGTHNITLYGANISADKNGGSPFSIQSGCKVNLNLKKDNTLTCTGGRASLEVPFGSTLIITEDSTGSLTANGGSQSAGIGGSKYDSNYSLAGIITINGGDITAIGGGVRNSNGVGIGNGYNPTNTGDGCKITINGGKVVAQGTNCASGIGVAEQDRGNFTVTINGGVVKATGGSNRAPGIGHGGPDRTLNYSIAINGGDVTAIGGNGGAGIGHAGYKRECCNIFNTSIIITGGTVNATGGENGAGIGGGNNYRGSNVTISGGNVTAIGGTNASGIGSGANNNIKTELLSGDKGTAWINASSVSSNTTGFVSGVLFNGNEGNIYGNQNLCEDYTIESSKKIIVGKEQTLAIEAGKTLTVAGTLVNHGAITGTIVKTDEGTIECDNHIPNHHEAVAATCFETGSKEYWDCSVCSRLFSDVTCTTETTLADVTIGASHKLTNIDGKEGTCTEKGTGKYWICSVCHKMFSDEGVTEINEIPIISAKGHDYIYNNSGDTHIVTCKRDGCNYCEENVAHTYDGETGLCVCGAEIPKVNVTFNGKSGNTLASTAYRVDTLPTEPSAIAIPTAPYFVGLNYAGWTLNGETYNDITILQEAILTKIAALENVTVQAKYEQEEITYDVSIVNGNGTETKKYKSGSVVTVKADNKEGLTFVGWANESNSIISYNESYAFSVTSNRTITATYAEEEVKKVGTTYIEKIISNVRDGKISFVSMSSVPENCIINVAGVIATSNTSIGDNADSFIAENAEFVRGDATTKHNAKYTWTKGKVVAEQTWYVRAYLVYTDEIGDQHTVYGDIVKATIDGRQN